MAWLKNINTHEEVGPIDSEGVAYRILVNQRDSHGRTEWEEISVQDVSGSPTSGDVVIVTADDPAGSNPTSDGEGGYSWLTPPVESVIQTFSTLPGIFGASLIWSGSKWVPYNLPIITTPQPWFLAVDANWLYWGTSGVTANLGRANLDGSSPNPNFITGLPGGAGAFEGIFVTPSALWWIDNNNGQIGKANLDGSGVNDSVVTGLPNPGGLAVDGSHIYWCQASVGVGRANLDGSGVNQTFIPLAGNVEGVAVDASHIYFALPDDAAIGRANLDGSGVNLTFITGIPAGPWELRVNSTHIYWSSLGQAIGRANLDGSGVVQNRVFSPDSTIVISGLALDANWIYFTDVRFPTGYIGRTGI